MAPDRTPPDKRKLSHGVELHWNSNHQSPLVFTAPNGRLSTKNSSMLSFDLARSLSNCDTRVKKPRQDSSSSSSSSDYRRSSAPPTEQFANENQQPDFVVGRMPFPLFSPPRPAKTPSKPPRASSFGIQGLPLPRTPQLSTSAKKLKLKAAMKLKALENQGIEAFRQEHAKTELWLDRQEKAYRAWLNHALTQPMKSGSRIADISLETASITSNDSSRFSSVSDLSCLSSESALVPSDNKFSVPVCARKQAAKQTPRGGHKKKTLKTLANKPGKESLSLDACLQAICSIPVLRQRLEPYLDAKSREDVISIMTQLAKHIDEGRLKMKDGCTILTDVALREKAIQVLMNYDTSWLKIGLHVVLGHSALITKEKLESMVDTQEEEEVEDKDSQYTLLKLIIEKHFLAHAGLAKYHATNKTIEGLYKPGYHEALGRVILKRLLLLVLTLDKAKCQSTLQVAFGIDGLDGGSPLLFHRNASIKSSRQALQEFLLDAMHGEGDIIGHLGVLGYHVSHVQTALAEYSFEVKNLIEDLQDGVRLCRLVQVLLSDASLLMKIKLPSNHRRYRIHNCGIALECLARAGVPLTDEHGSAITVDDVVAGDREKALPLLWNVMVHLQIPILVTAQRLWQEIVRIEGCDLNSCSLTDSPSLLDLLLKWAQVICATYGLPVDDFKTSFTDGQALCYLISFYFPRLLPYTAIRCPLSCSPQKNLQGSMLQALAEVNVNQTPKAKTLVSSQRIAVTHNFGLIKDVICKLGNVPEVLQSADLIDGDPSCSERNIIIFLVFLSSQLLGDTSLIVEKMAALHWDAGLTSQEMKVDTASKARSGSLEEEELIALQGRAATKIQSSFKVFFHRREFLKWRTAATLIQSAVRKWLASKAVGKNLCQLANHELLLTSESCSVSQLEAAVTLIQTLFRGRLARSKYKLKTAQILKVQILWKAHKARQLFLLQKRACLTIQYFWRRLMARKMDERRHSELLLAVTKIQVWWRKCHTGRKFLKERAAAVLIQSCFRSYIHMKQYRRYKESVVKLQALVRSRYERKRFCSYRDLVKKIQCCWRSRLAERKQTECFSAVITIQAWWRKCLIRRSFLKQRAAAISLQSHFRSHIQTRRYKKYKECVVKLQALVKSRYERKRYGIYRNSVKKIQCFWRSILAERIAQRKLLLAVIRIQGWWRKCLARGSFLEQRAAAIQLQSHIRSYIYRTRHKRYRECIVKVQALIRSRREQKRYCKYRDSAERIQKHFRLWLAARRELSRATEMLARQIMAARKIQAAWRMMQIKRIFFIDISLQIVQLQAAVTVQRYYRGYIARRSYEALKATAVASALEYQQHPEEDLAASDDAPSIAGFDCECHVLDQSSDSMLQRWVQMIQQRRDFMKLRRSAVKLQRWWRDLLRHRSNAATIIQRHFRGWVERNQFSQKKLAIKSIQARWRGCLVRQSHGQMRQQLSELRQRMQNTAANVDSKMRLENRLTEALAALLSQKTVSGILHTCATIDLATQHSKLCCERLIEAGAITKLLQLIQTTNRSPPHEEVLKHALSILANLARYPEFAKLVADAPGSIATIAEQLLRNKEEVLSKTMTVLQLVCKVPSGIDGLRRRPSILRRLHNLSQALEKKVEVESRTLARLPSTTPIVLRMSGEKKVSDAIAQHHSIVLLLQEATGEDLQTRLKAVRRMSSIYQVKAPRLSVGRFPLQDCSNQ